MLFVSKQQLGAALGNAHFWFPKQLGGLEYSAGIPDMDAIRSPTVVKDKHSNRSLVPNR